MNLINAKALERRMDVVVNYAYYDAVPVRERKPNPLNLSAQQLTVIKSPTDLNGTAALSWRFRDPTKRDNSWAYVPPCAGCAPSVPPTAPTASPGRT